MPDRKQLIGRLRKDAQQTEREYGGLAAATIEAYREAADLLERDAAVLEAADNARTAMNQAAIGIAKEKADQEYVEMLEAASIELITALRHAQGKAKP